MKEVKQSTLLQKPKNEKALARNRFEKNEEDLTTFNCNISDDLPENPDASALVPSKNPFTTQYVDPEMDEKLAIKKLVLPPETLYLIDKVVRAKAKAGPIGIDNSEVINLEIEKEQRQQNKYFANLAEKKRGRTVDSDEESDCDSEERGMTIVERENLVNEKLLQRLYKAAERDLDA